METYKIVEYKTVEEIFEEKMKKLSSLEIVNLINKTWYEEEGGIIIEAGFTILDDRLGEESSDRLYNYLWEKHFSEA